MILFFGLLQHCSMSNQTPSPRTAVIIQYLPKFVRPMEDLKLSVRSDIQDSASGAFKRMLGLDNPYPAILDPDLLPENQDERQRKYDL